VDPATARPDNLAFTLMACSLRACGTLARGALDLADFGDGTRSASIGRRRIAFFRVGTPRIRRRERGRGGDLYFGARRDHVAFVEETRSPSAVGPFTLFAFFAVVGGCALFSVGA